MQCCLMCFDVFFKKCFGVSENNQKVWCWQIYKIRKIDENGSCLLVSCVSFGFIWIAVLVQQILVSFLSRSLLASLGNSFFNTSL